MRGALIFQRGQPSTAVLQLTYLWAAVSFNPSSFYLSYFCSCSNDLLDVFQKEVTALWLSHVDCDLIQSIKVT